MTEYVRCISNDSTDYLLKKLTVGRVYEVVNRNTENEVRIIVEDGRVISFYERFFEAAEKPVEPTANVVRLLESGVRRVLEGQVGMTFFVDKEFTRSDGTKFYVIRDYRYGASSDAFQPWSIDGEDVEIVS